MTIPFTKMQGLGNDYIYIDCTNRQLLKALGAYDFSALARQLSDRHFGIGSDGLVLIMPSDKADFAMRIFNADGSEAEMCGNAARCIGKYVYEQGLISREYTTLETKLGVRNIQLFINHGQVEKVKVNMGKAVSKPIRLNIEGVETACTFVDIGNPHVVVSCTDDIDSIDIKSLGSEIEHSIEFPYGTNVEFVNILNDRKLRMRVWERGSGETMACGTGACAAAVALAKRALEHTDVTVHLKGGDLLISKDNLTEDISQCGEAQTVFRGELMI